MRIEHGGKPEFNVFELARTGSQPLCNGLSTDRGVAAGAAVVDPVAGLDHIGDLLGGSLFVTNFLLHGCCHSLPSIKDLKILDSSEDFLEARLWGNPNRFTIRPDYNFTPAPLSSIYFNLF
jgi:hypothetical protein